MVAYVRSNFFAGEEFRDIDDCRSSSRALVRAISPGCGSMALRGCARPRYSPPRNFRTSSRYPRRCSTSRPGPTRRWHRIGMCRSLKALYSVPGELIGQAYRCPR